MLVDTQGVSTAGKLRKAQTSPGKATTKWMKPPATAGLNFKKTDRSRVKSVSTTAMTQPSRPAAGEFFSNLLSHALRRLRFRADWEAARIQQ